MNDAADDEFTTPLVPVSEWSFNLYRVKYFTSEGGRLVKHSFCVSTASHIESEVNRDYYIPQECEWVEWEPVVQNVRRPLQIGTVYGQRLDEDGWISGRRLAHQLKIGV